MDLDKLRTQWNSIELPSDAETTRIRELEERVRDNRVTTLRDKLFFLTRNLVFFSVLGLLTMIPFVSESPILVITTGAFFVLMGLLNLYRALTIRQFDITTMNLREAMKALYRIERQKLICKIIGIVCAVPLLIYMAMTFADLFGPWALYGALAGTFIGGVIGLMINHKATALLREMKRQLSEDGLE